jgi:hypothetical protein
MHEIYKCASIEYMHHETNKRSTQKRINLISIDLSARYLSNSFFFNYYHISLDEA